MFRMQKLAPKYFVGNEDFSKRSGPGSSLGTIGQF